MTAAEQIAEALETFVKANSVPASQFGGGMSYLFNPSTRDVIERGLIEDGPLSDPSVLVGLPAVAELVRLLKILIYDMEVLSLDPPEDDFDTATSIMHPDMLPEHWRKVLGVDE